jgi:hypothetical protein
MKKTFKHEKFIAVFSDEGTGTGNRYFSLTGEIDGASGACGEKIVEIYPAFQVLNDLHLASLEGVPMYALENGYYHFERTKFDVAALEEIKPIWKEKVLAAYALVNSDLPGIEVLDIGKKSIFEYKAEEFLQKTGTKMKAEFLTNNFYFYDDKEARDIYKITLARTILGDKEKSYSFRFGQSIANSGEYVKRNPAGKTMYDHELIRRPRGRIAPSAYDVLACVQKYDVGTFGNFCSDFGYDEDSRKAEKMYLAVQKGFGKIHDLFSDVMEELREIN